MLDPHHVTQFEMFAAAQNRDFALQTFKTLLLTESRDPALFDSKNFDCNLFLCVQVCCQFDPKSKIQPTLTLHSDRSLYSDEASSGHQVLSWSKSQRFPTH